MVAMLALFSFSALSHSVIPNLKYRLYYYRNNNRSGETAFGKSVLLYSDFLEGGHVTLWGHTEAAGFARNYR